MQHSDKHPGLLTSQAAVRFLRQVIDVDELVNWQQGVSLGRTAAAETQGKKMSREAGLSGEWLQSDSWENQRMRAGLRVMGCFPFSFLQVPCTQCTETTSRGQHRIPGRSRTPIGPGAARASSIDPWYIPNKAVLRKIKSLLHMGDSRVRDW